MHCNKHAIFIKLNATFLVLEKAMKHLEVGSFRLTCLSYQTSFLPFAPYAVHLIVALLRLVLQRVAPYAAHLIVAFVQLVLRQFTPYAAHIIQRFALDASALTV